MWIDELENDIVTVSRLQVALRSTETSVQTELTNLTLEADTQTVAGLKQLLAGAVLILLRKMPAWTHVFGESQTVPSREAAETLFNRLSIAERRKFSAETLTNVNGKIRQQPVALDPGEDPAYIVVTLLVGTADDKPLFAPIDSQSAMEEALHQTAAMPTDYLMVFELLWSPQVETDALTVAELESEYGYLAPIPAA